MTRWEYKLINSADAPGSGWLKSADREALEHHLNELGADGWEIVGVDFTDAERSERSFLALARRPLP